MTNFNKLKDTPENLQKDELLDSLFEHASTRPRAPAEDEAAIRAATHAEWKKITGQRKRKRYLATFGLAASLIVGVILVGILKEQTPTDANPEQLAGVELQTGDVFIRDRQGDNSMARRLASHTLYAGQVISTNTDTRLALDWKTGESIRLDENSEIALISVSEIELLAGRVYVDTGQSAQVGTPFVIKTFVGVIQHLGTQYLAGISDNTVTLAVREGQVSLNAVDSEVTVNKGELANIGPAGKMEVTHIEIYGAMWEWANQVTPELKLDGLSVFDFVHWAGRETGREVQFSDAAIQKLAMQTRLRGSVNLAPDLALELILETSDIEALTSEGRIFLQERTGT